MRDKLSEIPCRVKAIRKLPEWICKYPQVNQLITVNPKATLSWEYRGNSVKYEQILDFLHRPVTTDSKEEAFLRQFCVSKTCLVHECGDIR